MIKVFLAASSLISIVAVPAAASETVPKLEVETLQNIDDSSKTLNTSVIEGVKSEFHSTTSDLMEIESLEKKLGQLLYKKSKLTAEKTMYTELKTAVDAKLTSLTKNDYKVESDSSSPQTYKLKKESGSKEPRQHYLIALVPLDEKIKTILEGDTTNLGKLTTFNQQYTKTP